MSDSDYGPSRGITVPRIKIVLGRRDVFNVELSDLALPLARRYREPLLKHHNWLPLRQTSHRQYAHDIL
jgi:hypothetical protein